MGEERGEAGMRHGEGWEGLEGWEGWERTRVRRRGVDRERPGAATNGRRCSSSTSHLHSDSGHLGIC